MLIRVLCIFVCASFSFINNAEKTCLGDVDEIEISLLSKSLNSVHEKIQKFLPEKFLLQDVDYNADIHLDAVDLNATLGLSKGTIIDRTVFIEHVVDITKKQKFKKIFIKKKPVADGIRLTISLQSYWTVARIHMQGTLLGRDQYKMHYLLEVGEKFDFKKHNLGLEKIKQALKEDGYFDASLKSSFVYNKNKKLIDVVIAVDPKNKFVVSDVIVHIETQENMSHCNCVLLKQQVKDVLCELLVQRQYAKKLINDSAKYLHNFLIDKGFLNSTIYEREVIKKETQSVEFIFSIVLRNKNVFEFYGNTFFSKRQLLDRILLFGKSITLVPPALIADELIRFYREAGFHSVQIEWQDDGERIFFFINEGERIRISRVCILGAIEIPERDLLRRHFHTLMKEKHFNDNMLRAALENLAQEYVTQGFWDFTIVAYDWVVQKNGTYQLEIKIKEGKRRWLVGTTIEDAAQYGLAHYCQEYTTLAQAIPFDLTIIQKQKNVLTGALRDAGRLYFVPRPQLVEVTNGLRLIWKFSGDPTVVRFGDTILVGDGKLPAAYIKRELAYKKGDIWDQRKVEQSVVRLKSLGIFDVLSLSPDDIAAETHIKTMVLKYGEDSRYEIRARLGIQGVNRNIVKFKSDGISYKVGGSCFIKNPGGFGDRLIFDVDFSRFMHNISCSYAIPWMLDYPVRCEIKGYSNRCDQPVIVGSPEVLYRSAQDGVLLGFSRDYNSCEFGFSVGCEGIKISPNCLLFDEHHPFNLSRAIHLDKQLINHHIPYVFAEGTFFASFIDNKIQPTTGTLSLISVKAIVPPTIRHASCLKIMLEQSVFIPFFEAVVLAFRGRCGTIFGADFTKIMPIERFYLGGAYSVRGYEPDVVPPLNVFCDSHGQKRLVPTGGKSLLNVNSEIRFPLYGRLSGVVFNDFGALSDHGRNAVEIHNVVGAVGFGLRLNTAVGPIRFDIGWKLKSAVLPHGFGCQRPYAWFLALGNAF